jgi:hypothetical protein
MNELKNKSKFLRDQKLLAVRRKGKGLFAVDGNHSTNFRRSVYAGAVE